MNRSSFKKLIRECTEEVLKEKIGGYGSHVGGYDDPKTGEKRIRKIDPKEPMYLKKVSDIPGETPFVIGNEKVKFVYAKYPDPTMAPVIGVESEKTGHVYSLARFKDTRELVEGNEDEDPLYVEYVKEMPGEEPFMMQGEKFQYVWAKYPNGKIDIGVYAFRGDLVYGYNAFRQRYNIKEDLGSNRSDVIYKDRQGGRDVYWVDSTDEGRIYIKPESVGKYLKQGYRLVTLAREEKTEKPLKEMTGTSAAQGFMGKNWVDPDPKRSRMKDIAKKSVGGDLA